MSAPICIIPARGGSKRLPGKNIRMFHGRPIISYSIRTAQDAGIRTVFVSSDSDEILSVAEGFGATGLKRSTKFSQDDVTTKQVMDYCVSQAACSADTMVACVYPCAPLFDYRDLSCMILMVHQFRSSGCVAVGTEPLADAGAAYVMRAVRWRDHLAGIYSIRTFMYPVESKRVCDINTEEDWGRAERMYEDLHRGDEKV